jgi:hypothetical protein
MARSSQAGRRKQWERTSGAKKLWFVNTHVSKSFRSIRWRRIARQAPLSVLGAVQAMYKMRGFLIVMRFAAFLRNMQELQYLPTVGIFVFLNPRFRSRKT